ncbi:hypothetical protein [Streptomyces sp. NPDC002619]|uniref:hypothetical protein n=1 Tax=Streptomyces sp. NPDC002619 TaxID=3364655 RepID=UPI00367C0BD3
MVVGRVAVRHVFDQHTLDGAAVRAALLDLVVQLGLLPGDPVGADTRSSPLPDRG